MTNSETGLLTSIVRSSLRFRGVIIALAFLLLGYGLYSLSKAKYEVFPEFAPPQVMIQTEAPGLSPEQVEVLITQQIENAINGVSGIDSLRSGSIQGLSVITVVFNAGSDIYRARQMVTERLATLAGRLPQGVQAPVMTPLTSSTSIALVVGLTSDTRSLMELRTTADWTIKQRLLAVPGVAHVGVYGGEAKQLQIQVRPDQLIKYNLAIDDVLTAARRATGIRGAGFIENGNQRIVLQTEGQSILPAQLAKTVLLRQNGVSVNLGDVAQVAEGPEPPVGAASVMGKTGVQLVVAEQYGENTVEITHKVEQALEELRPVLKAEGITLHSGLFRPANFIQTATHNVQSSLLIGAVLVIIVLFLFLFNLRTAAISCTAIPLSLLAAVIVLEYLGFSLNTMTLGGLAIAIGEVVDDAVIDVENILRRLRENRRLENPRSVFRVVLDASIEVRSAVVYATFAVILVFFPILTMTGLAGQLFAPLGVAYILAVLASLLVALTLTPALCLLFLGHRDLPEKEPPVVRWLKERYRSLLMRVERQPRTVIGAVSLFTLVGLAALPSLRGEFLPELREGHYLVHMAAVPGTSLQESLRLGRQATLELLKIPYVHSIAQRVGRAEKADEIYGTHYSELDVELKPLRGKQAELAQSEIRRALSQFTGVSFAVMTFLSDRINETISGHTAPVVVNIFGKDLDTLDAKVQEVTKVLRAVPGAADVQLQSPPGTPQLMVRLRKDDLSRWGGAPIDALDAIRVAYQGNVVGQVYDGNRIFDVSVILDPKERESVSDIGALPLRNSEGSYISLRQVADIYEANGRYSVLHQGARRVQTVTCNVTGRDVNSFVNEAKKRILTAVSFPAGTYLEFTGAAEEQARSRKDLMVHSLLAGVGIILLLSIVMRTYRNLLLVLVNLPFALVGGVLALFITRGSLSIGSLVGFVTLFGITLRNSIMMVSHFEHLIAAEGMTWGRETAIRGASERLAPILMTALVTALGLLPLAIGSGEPGREIEGPMALVILGGLATSTVLNLLVLPTLALRYGRFQNKNQGETGEMI